MANIPQSPDPSATSENLPTPYNTNRVTPDNDGVWNQIGAAAQNAAPVAAQLAENARDRARASAIADSESKIQAGLTNLGHDPTIAPGTAQIDPITQQPIPGTGRPQGFLLQRGDNAQKGYQPTLDQADKLVAGAINDADDPEVKRILQMRAPTLLNDFKRTAAIHVGDQLDAMNNQALENRVTTGLDAYVNAGLDPVAREQALTKLRPWAFVGAQQQGDVDGGQARWLKIQKEAATRALQNIIALPDDQYPDKGEIAQKYLDTPLVKDGSPAREVLGADRDAVHLVQQIGAVNQAAAAEKQAQSYFAKGPPAGASPDGELSLDNIDSVYRADGSGRVDRGALLTKIESQIPPGTFRDQTIARAFRKATEIDEGWKDRAQQAATRVVAATRNDRDGRLNLESAPAQDVTALAQIWPERYQELRKQSDIAGRIARNASDWQAKQMQAQADKEGLDRATTALNDVTQYSQTVKMTDAEFKAEFQGTMNPQQWQHVYETFQKSKARINDPRPIHESIIQQGRAAFGIADNREYAELTPEERQPLVELEQAVDRRYADELADAGPGKTIPPQRQAQIVAEELAKTDVEIPNSGIFYNNKKLRYQVDNEAAASASAPATPSTASATTPAKSPVAQVPIMTPARPGKPSRRVTIPAEQLDAAIKAGATRAP